MKTEGSQETDYRAVKKVLEKNPEMSTKAAIEQVAKAHSKQFGSVQAAYYRLSKRYDANLAVTAPAPPKKKTPTRKTTSKPDKPNSNLDLNIIRASLSNALAAIDVLERQNRANDEIINNLRKALSV